MCPLELKKDHGGWILFPTNKKTRDKKASVTRSPTGSCSVSLGRVLQFKVRTPLLQFDPGKVQVPFQYWLRPGVTQVQTESFMGFSGGSVDKESACSAGDLVLIPGCFIYQETIQELPQQSSSQDSTLSLPKAQVQSLVTELRSHRLQGAAKKKKIVPTYHISRAERKNTRSVQDNRFLCLVCIKTTYGAFLACSGD